MIIKYCPSLQSNDICAKYGILCDRIKDCYTKRFKKARAQLKKKKVS